jgi:hypothetical protein
VDNDYKKSNDKTPFLFWLFIGFKKKVKLFLPLSFETIDNTAFY